MAGRPGLDPVEEGKSLSALFVLMVALLLAVSVWSIWDDNISRRPWKQYQVEFDQLAYDHYMRLAAAEEEKLAEDPDYERLQRELAEAEAERRSGETLRRLEDLENRLSALKIQLDDREQDVRFTKSYLTEQWYFYNRAIQDKQDPSRYKRRIEELDAQLVREEAAAAEVRAKYQAVRSEIEKLNERVVRLRDELGKLTRARDELLDRANNYMVPVTLFGRVLLRYPRIPKIEQTVIDGFDRNAFDQMVARVDRCMSCHVGIDKQGFEDAPQPFKTHSNFEQIILKHPPDQLGCTPCHEGQGPAVNSVAAAHGFVRFWEHPLLLGDKMQSRCIKCHIDVGSLRNSGGAQIAHNWVEGERLFEQLGCHGCHLTAGYEELPKIGPYLKRAAAKLDPSWTVRWIKDPQAFRPHTRMPDFMFDDTQALQISAYILQSSRGASDQWLAAHPEPSTLKAALTDSGLIEQGKGLFESVGCLGCHSAEPGQLGSPVGSFEGFKPAERRTTKDFAPNLSRIAEKTSARWIYFWLRNPADYAAHPAMPSLRLTDREALAVTAYLMTLGSKREDPQVVAQLADPDNAAQGEALVRKYGCFGCHEIEGMDKESRIGVELSTFGSKHLDELFFGERVDIPATWDEWTYWKLQHPRIYATEDVEQLMPNFYLDDADIKNLSVFLAGLTEGRVPERYRSPGTDRQRQIVEGRRSVNYYNCVGCHQIENRGGYIARYYEGDEAAFAPPILEGEGAKVQPQWLFGFLQHPTPIRPWLSVRMPTFGFTNRESDVLVNYFTALADVKVPYVFLNTDLIPADMLRAGQELMSVEYFNCFSCHQQGEKKPEGPPSGWAPDLALAYERLNPDWVIEWIKDPQKLQPGTRMPAFYPGGPDDILDGNEDLQIRAMRDYIFWLGAHPGRPLPSRVAGGPTQLSKR
jgi:mono/diheme cytochrome c family protein